RWALSACATLGVGAMHAVVRELTPLDPGDRVFAAASLGPELSVGLAAGIRAELGAMAFVPLVRPEFVQRGVAEPVFESRVVGVLGLAGLAFQTR
ncbi:MAG TPA: hypothetical protein VFQ35_20380, partial [Polyangiaceae bacterium]|nr:hypothetical protein [Polyangiaceae bacterium]